MLLRQARLWGKTHAFLLLKCKAPGKPLLHKIWNKTSVIDNWNQPTFDENKRLSNTALAKFLKIAKIKKINGISNYRSPEVIEGKI